ncbi:MAG: hypothetical protein WC482_04180 [Candidatus Omnitrophota bacterium]|nr:hypothetical protein [Candidatus Omnitrophota bacterium]
MCTCLIFILRGPFYESVVDISVSPPENIRKTDFSWITVNEWFNGQIYIISSHTLLKDVVSDINGEKLRKMVHAKRLGAADIIRLSVRSEEKPETLLKLAAEISDLYIKKINEDTPEEKKNKEKKDEREKEALKKEALKKDGNLILKNSIDALYDKRVKIKSDIYASIEQVRNYELSLNKSRQDGTRSQDIKNRLSGIENETSALTQKLTHLRTIYTDNWLEIVSLKEKIGPLEEEKRRLMSELNLALKREAEERLICDMRDNENTRLSKLKDELNLIDIRLDESLNMMTEETPPVPEMVKERLSKGMSYAYILNPPTLNFLPDLEIQLINGAFIGFAIWFAIGLYTHIRRPSD